MSTARPQRTRGCTQATGCWGSSRCCTWPCRWACSSTASGSGSVPGGSGSCTAACLTAGAQGWHPGRGVSARGRTSPHAARPARLSPPPPQEPRGGESGFQKLPVHPVPGRAQAHDGHALRPPLLLGVHHPVVRHQGQPWLCSAGRPGLQSGACLNLSSGRWVGISVEAPRKARHRAVPGSRHCHCCECPLPGGPGLPAHTGPSSPAGQAPPVAAHVGVPGCRAAWPGF